MCNTQCSAFTTASDYAFHKVGQSPASHERRVLFQCAPEARELLDQTTATAQEYQLGTGKI